MEKKEFVEIYRRFLRDVAKITPVNDAGENRIFFLYKERPLSEIKKALTGFFYKINDNKYPSGVEPLAVDWENMFLYLNLDHKYKTGVRLIPQTEDVRRGIGEQAKRMRILLSGVNGDDISGLIKKIK